MKSVLHEVIKEEELIEENVPEMTSEHEDDAFDDPFAGLEGDNERGTRRRLGRKAKRDYPGYHKYIFSSIVGRKTGRRKKRKKRNLKKKRLLLRFGYGLYFYWLY